MKVLTTVLTSLATVGLITVSAADPGEPAFTTRVYQFPPDVFFVLVDQKRPTRPRSPKAKPTEIQKFIDESSIFVAERLAANGILLPQGTIIAYDDPSGTLAIKTDARTHDVIRIYAESALADVPHIIQWQLHIVEVSSKDFVSVLPHEAQSMQDATQIRDTLIQKGAVKTLLTGESQIGTPNKVSTAPVVAGTPQAQIEIDAVASEPFQFIHIDLNLGYSKSTIKSDASAGGKIAQQASKLWTSLNIKNNTSHLVGVSRGVKPNTLEAAFLAAKCSPLMVNPVNDLTRCIDAAHSVKLSNAATLAPHGMATRQYRVAPDFLSIDEGSLATQSKAADPFASSSTRIESNLDTNSRSKKILVDQGIEFPPGSSVIYSPKSGHLIITNYPQNHDLIKAFICGMRIHEASNIMTRFYLVEVNQGLAPKLKSALAASTDHSGIWREFETDVAAGDGKILDTAWVQTQSGTLSTFVCGSGPISHQAKAPGSPPGSPSSAPPFAEIAQSEGLSLQIDGVVCADNNTIDLNLSLDWDELTPSDEVAGKGAKSDSNFQFNTSTKLLSGTPRLLSIWKPASSKVSETGSLYALFVRADIATLNDDREK